MAKAQEYFDAWGAAAKTYECAAQKAAGAEKLRLLKRAAVAHARDEAAPAALGALDQMRVVAELVHDGELILLPALMEVTERLNDRQLNLAAMERITEMNPGDTAMVFKLAFAHSEAGNNDLAMLHYLRIPHQDRDGATWNNIGVAFDKASLPAKGVDAYERSEMIGGTIATSNLAVSLVGAGFLKEAERRCRAAMTTDGFDENVGLTLARVKDVLREEEKKEAELLSKAKRKCEFYRAFGRAASLSRPGELSERWKGQNCVLTVKVAGETFLAVGSYDQPQNALTSAILGGMGFGSQTAPVRIQEEYTGVIRGRSMDGYVTRTREGEPPASLLGSLDNRTALLMMLSDDGSELKVMENPQGINPRFYSLTRQGI